MSRWGSWCAIQGHAPRLLVPKQHHLVQAQALHATAAAAAAARRASAVRTAPATAIAIATEQQRRREQKRGGGRQRDSITERIDWTVN